jgi:hypothetical protein
VQRNNVKSRHNRRTWNGTSPAIGCIDGWLCVCVCVCVCVRARARAQAYHALSNPGLYGLEEGDSCEAAVLRDLGKEVSMLASLRHDRMLSFRGVVLDGRGKRPKLIILEPHTVACAIIYGR